MSLCPGPYDGYQTCKSLNTNKHMHVDNSYRRTHIETNARSIFIVFGSAAVYVLPSLSVPHTLHSKNKNLYYRPASVTTIILLKQPLKTNYICTVFIRLLWVSNAYWLGWVSLQPSDLLPLVYCLLHGAANDWPQST